MNNKITFPRLASMLADKSGRSKRFSEDFLREFFTLISERLVAGESVKIKGLGTFKLSKVEARKSVDVTTGESMEIAGHSKVVFLPSKDIATAVNSPFEAFTAIEISDDADISQLFNEQSLDKQTYDDVESEQDNFITHEETVEALQDSPAVAPVIAFMEETEEESITKPNIMQASENKNVVIEKLEENEIPEETSYEIAEFDESENINEITEIEESEDINEIAEVDESEDIDEISEIEESEDLNEIAIPDESEEIADVAMREETEGIDDDIAVSQVLAKTPEAEAEEPAAESSQEETDNQPPEEAEESDEFHEIDVKKIRRNNWKKGILIGLVAAVCALFATFAIWYIFATNDFNKMFNKTASSSSSKGKDSELVADNTQSADAAVESTPAIALEDSTADTTSSLKTEMEVPTSPSDPVVYDTISTTRYLTTMAKSHYGNYNLWPYIYEENKSKLGHPDRIRPGTPVVIPKLSKYGVDATNPADIEKAKKMGVEIYSRYGKKI